MMTNHMCEKIRHFAQELDDAIFLSFEVCNILNNATSAKDLRHKFSEIDYALQLRTENSNYLFYEFFKTQDYLQSVQRGEIPIKQALHKTLQLMKDCQEARKHINI